MPRWFARKYFAIYRLGFGDFAAPMEFNCRVEGIAQMVCQNCRFATAYKNPIKRASLLLVPAYAKTDSLYGPTTLSSFGNAVSMRATPFAEIFVPIILNFTSDLNLFMISGIESSVTKRPVHVQPFKAWKGGQVRDSLVANGRLAQYQCFQTL